MKIIAGTSNFPIAKEIAKNLEKPLTNRKIKRFSDQEIYVEIEESVRGEDVFVIQSTSQPANDNLMELLIIMDALRRASAGRVMLVMPYFGYARQDRKVQPRTPISAKLVADLLATTGANRIVTMDLHAGQIQGFFNIPVDNLFGGLKLIEKIKEDYKNKDLIIISPDVGGVERARALAKRLEVELAIVDKRREKANHSEVMHIIGDIKDKDCVIVDDMVDTAGTLCNSADALLKAGAKSVAAYVTHGVLSGPAIERIAKSGLESITITDTIEATQETKNCDKIRQISVAPLFAQAMDKILKGESLSALFN